MTQLLIHLWGDYILQSDWMAQNKTKAWFPATVHALVYSAAFVLLRPSLKAWAVIFGTHLLIDRFRLARYVVWVKNWMGPFYEPVGIRRAPAYETQFHWVRKNPTPSFEECKATGYPPNNPVWMSVWLMIIADNILHLTINFLSLKFL